MSSLSQGVLGFISGFAGGKAEEADLLAGEERAEALRLRKEESALLKERRLLKIRSDFATKERDDLLTTDSLIDPQGNVITEGLDPDLAQQANRSNIRQLRKEQRSIDEKRRVQSEKTSVIAPGSTVLSEQEKQARLAKGGGSFTTDARPPSRSEINREWSGIKQGVRSSISGQGGKFGTTERKALSNATIEFLDDTGTNESLAYRAMIATEATDSIIREMDAQQNKQGSNFVTPTSSRLIASIKERGGMIDQEFRAATSILETKMQEEMDANPTQDRATLAKKLINEAQSFARPDGKRITMSPKKRLQDADLWHESMQDIIFNTLSSVKGVVPEEEGFFKGLLK